jgi:hypothetical protein
MVDHETRRKIIRQWMSLPNEKRQTLEQAADFARKAIEQNELHPSRRGPYERVVGWLLPRTSRSHTRLLDATGDHWQLGAPHCAMAARGMDTRRLQHFLGHASITNTMRYTAMSPEPFKDIWR